MPLNGAAVAFLPLLHWPNKLVGNGLSPFRYSAVSPVAFKKGREPFPVRQDGCVFAIAAASQLL